MKSTCWCVLTMGFLAAACGGGPGNTVKVTVADHGDALTAKAGDNLFTVTLTAADEAWPTRDLSVTAGLPGTTATVMNFTLDDKNADSKWGVGETLTVTEPVVNLFDPTTVGKVVNVDVSRKSNGIYYQLGSASWSPAN